MENPPLNLPPYDMKIMHDGGRIKIYDRLRKKYVALTPEEYVRQHFINWLIEYLHYPASIVNNEITVDFNGMSRRCDTVVFRPGDSPLMIVEYKAPDVNITQETFDQIYRYNSVLKARMLVVSNGLRHYCCVMDYDNDSYHFIPKIPDYRELTFGGAREN